MPICQHLHRLLGRCLRPCGLALAWVAALVAASVVAPAIAAPPPVQLDAATVAVDAWPAVTLLADPDGQLTIDQVLARRSDFVAPDGPHANLGPRRDAVWLRIPVQVAAQAGGRWVLALEYASIDQADLYVVGDVGSTQTFRLGRMRPHSQHPLPSASHAVPIRLEPGARYELLLRVQTRSSMLVPLVLSTPEAFHAREARTQMLQGLLAGVGLCLLLYSLAHWLSLRDPMFALYALSLGGTGVFFVAYFGIGPQHLWGDSAWMVLHAAPAAVLVALVGGALFIDRALAVGELHPWVARALQAVAGVAGVAAVGFVAGLIGYPAASAIATVLGPLPMLLAVPVAYRRMRHGERVGLYMMIGWGIYAAATLVMAGLLRGWVPSNFWTQHAFQFGTLIEMGMWMRVLGLRIETLRCSAQRATLERDALRSMAHTDALTGLPNRRGLSEVLARELPRSRTGAMAVVLLLDLDGFKPVNDRFGHDAGDDLLVGVARRLESLLRASDTVARIGGDEFVVVATQVPGDAEAQMLGRKLLDGFREPFVVAGQPCQIGLTIGYAIAPLDGSDAASLLKRADAAMYAGKQAGRNCVRRGAASAGLVSA